MSKNKKNIMRVFKINEISAVDRPAQSHAKMTLMKRAEEGDPKDVMKRVQMTKSVKGHAHLIYDDGTDGGDTSWSKAEGEEYGHSHPWVRKADGTIVIGEAEGHTHELEDLLKYNEIRPDDESDEKGTTAKNQPANPGDNQEEGRMSTEAQKIADLEKSNQTLSTQLAAATAFGALNDAEKSYYNTLGDAQKEDFMKKSRVDRQSDIQKAADADPVVYKSVAGKEYRKSAGEDLIDAIKRADEAETVAKGEKAARQDSEYKKRAGDELKNLPGDEVAKVAILKAVDGIADEATRKSVGEMLKANNEKMAKAFETHGTTSGAENDATTQLNNLAKKYAADNKVDFNKAYDMVTQTPEGQALYEQATAA